MALVVIAGSLSANHIQTQLTVHSTALDAVEGGSPCSSLFFTKETLQVLGEQKFAGMLQDVHKTRKFEASDVIRVGSSYLVVFDSLYTVGKFAMNLPLYSEANSLIGTPGHHIKDEGEEKYHAVIKEAYMPPHSKRKGRRSDKDA